MSLNKITLSGNLGADAELRYTKSGNPVVSFSLAVNERTPNGDGTWGEYTNWPDCVMDSRPNADHRWQGARGARLEVTEGDSGFRHLPRHEEMRCDEDH